MMPSPERDETAHVPTRLTGLLWGLGFLAFAWRAIVFGQVGDVGPDAGAEIVLGLALGAMGLVYVACGLTVQVCVKDRAAALFALYAACQGLHWGGPIEVDGVRLQLAIWLFYFAVSMLGMSAILHFTLIYPWPLPAARSVTILSGIYAPVGIAAALAAGRVLMTEGAIAEFLQTAFLLLEAAQVNLFVLAGLVVLLGRTVRASPGDRRRHGLMLMSFAALVGVTIPTAATIAEGQRVELPGGLGSEPYNLLFICLPLSFAWAILRSRNASRQRNGA